MVLTVRFVIKSNVFSLGFSANNTHLYWFVLLAPPATIFIYQQNLFQRYHGEDIVQIRPGYPSGDSMVPGLPGWSVR